MSEQQPQPPSPLTPQPNRILAEPATPATCTADYTAAADVRARLDDQTHGRA